MLIYIACDCRSSTALDASVC